MVIDFSAYEELCDDNIGKSWGANWPEENLNPRPDSQRPCWHWAKNSNNEFPKYGWWTLMKQYVKASSVEGRQPAEFEGHHVKRVYGIIRVIAKWKRRWMTFWLLNLKVVGNGPWDRPPRQESLREGHERNYQWKRRRMTFWPLKYSRSAGNINLNSISIPIKKRTQI